MDLCQENQRLKIQVQDLLEEVRKLELKGGKADSLMDMVDELCAECKTLEGEVEIKNGEILELQAQVDDLQEDLTVAEDKRAELLCSLDSKVADDYDCTIRDLECTIEDLNTELSNKSVILMRISDLLDRYDPQPAHSYTYKTRFDGPLCLVDQDQLVDMDKRLEWLLQDLSG